MTSCEGHRHQIDGLQTLFFIYIFYIFYEHKNAYHVNILLLLLQGAAKMKVVVTLGRTKMEFRAKSNKKGIVEWNQGDEVQLPE